MPADVVVEVRSSGLTPERPWHRLGEAELRVLRHRHGPTTTVTTSFDPHHARLADRPDLRKT